VKHVCLSGSYSIGQSLRSRAHQLTFEYVSDSRALPHEAGQLRARTLHRQRRYGSTTVTWTNCSWWVTDGPIRGVWRAGGSLRETPVGERQGGFAGRSGWPRQTPVGDRQGGFAGRSGSPHQTPVGDRQGGFAGRSGSPHQTPRVGA
jgi:hypothetical protein